MTESHREALSAAARNRAVERRAKNKARDEGIVKAYVEDLLSLQAAGKKFGVTKDTAKAVILEAGHKLRGRGWTEASQRLHDNLDQVIADYESGMSRDAVAEKWGVSGASVGVELKKAGVPMRPRTGLKSIPSAKYTFN